MARVICIIGIVYVHAWTGLSGNDLELARGSAQETLRWILMEGFGRSAVPLLGLISGWLVAGSSRTLQWCAHVRHKARTILLPMVAWNAIAILLVSGAAWLFALPAPTPHSLGWVMEELFIFTHPPDINVQMPFLRDLFLCMVIAPLLVRAPGAGLGIVAVAAGTCHILALGPPIILRPSILMFFTIGILARRTGAADKVAAWSPVAALLPFAVLMPIHLYSAIGQTRPFDEASTAAIDLAARVAASIAVWWLCWRIAASRAALLLRRIEPCMFFYFCSHLILIWLAGPLIGELTGPLGSPLYPAYLLAQPFLILGAVILVAKWTTAVAPGTAALLSGGRLQPRRPSRT